MMCVKVSNESSTFFPILCPCKNLFALSFSGLQKEQNALLESMVRRTLRYVPFLLQSSSQRCGSCNGGQWTPTQTKIWPLSERERQEESWNDGEDVVKQIDQWTAAEGAPTTRVRGNVLNRGSTQTCPVINIKLKAEFNYLNHHLYWRQPIQQSAAHSSRSFGKDWAG